MVSKPSFLPNPLSYKYFRFLFQSGSNIKEEKAFTMNLYRKGNGQGVNRNRIG